MHRHSGKRKTKQTCFFLTFTLDKDEIQPSVSTANSVPLGSTLERKRKMIETLDVPKINIIFGKSKLLNCSLLIKLI